MFDLREDHKLGNFNLVLIPFKQSTLSRKFQIFRKNSLNLPTIEGFVARNEQKEFILTLLNRCWKFACLSYEKKISN